MRWWSTPCALAYVNIISHESRRSTTVVKPLEALMRIPRIGASVTFVAAQCCVSSR
jgi:hypothetical protein